MSCLPQILEVLKLLSAAAGLGAEPQINHGVVPLEATNVCVKVAEIKDLLQTRQGHAVTWFTDQRQITGATGNRAFVVHPFGRQDCLPYLTGYTVTATSNEFATIGPYHIGYGTGWCPGG